MNFNGNFRILPRRQISDFRYAPAVFDRFLQAAPFGLDDISKKAKNVEEIGFPRRIRAYDELAFAQARIDVPKIAPVFAMRRLIIIATTSRLELDFLF